MSLILRQSTAKAVSFGPFLDKTDGVTLEIGLVSAIDHATTGILLSKNGGALTIRSQAVTASTYNAYGNYIVTLSTTDTNTVGTLRMQFSEAATCLPVWQDFIVVEEAVYDALFASTAPGYLQPATAGRTLVVDAAGLADANVVKVGPTGAGTAQTAGDIPAMVTAVDDFVDAEITTILNRLGSITGTGTNTVLGFFQALLRSDAITLPTDIGGTFDNTTDSVEGIRNNLTTRADAIDAALVLIDNFVDAEVAAILALLDDPRGEPGQGAPPVNPDLATKIDYLYKAWRNKKDNDGTTTKLYADNGTTVDQKQTTSEAAGTVTKAEWVTGP